MATPARPRVGTILFISFAALALLALGLFGSLNDRLLHGATSRVHHWIVMPLFELGHVPISVTFLAKVTLFIVALAVAAGACLHLLQRRVLVHTPLSLSQQFAIARIASYVIFAIGIIIGLQSFGLNLNSLVVLGGALGLGVGLGLQTVVANFVAGLILLFEQPIRVGDRIVVGDTTGDVIDIRGRSTWVRTNDNIVIIVPNSDFITNKLTNWTVNDREVRIAIPVGVGYGSHPPRVRELLLRIASEHPDVLATPAPDVIFVDFGASSLDFMLRVWTTTQVQYPARLRSDLNFAIFEVFTREGIELPFAQTDLHLRTVDAAAVESLRPLVDRRPAAG